QPLHEWSGIAEGADASGHAELSRGKFFEWRNGSRRGLFDRPRDAGSRRCKYPYGRDRHQHVRTLPRRRHLEKNPELAASIMARGEYFAASISRRVLHERDELCRTRSGPAQTRLGRAWPSAQTGRTTDLYD